MLGLAEGNGATVRLALQRLAPLALSAFLTVASTQIGSQGAGEPIPESESNATVLSDARAAIERGEAARDSEEWEVARGESRHAADLLLPLPIGEGQEETGQLLWRAGYLATAIGNYELARDLWARVVAHCRITLPEDEIELLRAQGNLATQLRELGDLRGARPLMEAVLAGFEKRLPEDHVFVVKSRINLAAVLVDQHAYAEARKLLEKSVESSETSLPDVELLRARRDLASALEHTSELVRAREILERALADYGSKSPEDDFERLETVWKLGVICDEAGDLDRAHALLEEALDGFDRTLLPDNPHLLHTIDSLAINSGKRGERRRKLELMERALAGYEKIRAPEDDLLLEEKAKLARARAELGHVEGARILREEIHAVRERTLPPDSADLLEAKASLAEARAACGDMPGAMQLQEQILAVEDQKHGPESDAALRAKFNLALSRGAGGDPGGALDLLEEVLEVRERLLPPDDPRLPATLGAIASALADLEEFDRAIGMAEEVLAICRRAYPDDHSSVVLAKLNLARIHRRMWDLDEALSLLEEIHARSPRIDPILALNVEEALAGVRAGLGDAEGALATLEHVLEAREQLLPRNHPLINQTEANLAVMHWGLGDFEGALALLEHAYTADLQNFPADDPRQLVRKAWLANLYFDSGDVARAATLIEEVYEVRQQHLPEMYLSYLQAKFGVAVARAAEGEVDRAIELLEVVHEARQRVLPADSPDLLMDALNLGEAYRRVGELDRSKEFLDGAFAGLERFFSSDNTFVMEAAQQLAATRFALGDRAGAHELAERVLRELMTRIERLVFSGPRVARQAARNAMDLLGEQRLWRAEGQSCTCPELEFEVIETSRHLVVASRASELHELTSGDADAARARLRRAQFELDALMANTPELPDVQVAQRTEDDAATKDRLRAITSEWTASVREAALHRDRAQRELLSLLGDRVLKRVSSDSVAKALPPNHVAIGITKLGRWRWDAEKLDPVAADPHYLAHVVRPGRRLAEIDLGDAAALESRIAAWRTALGAPVERGDPIPEGDSAELKTGRELRRLLIDPLLAAAGELEPGATLHLCLDDALFTVPFAALPLDEEREAPAPVSSGDVPRLGDLHHVLYEISMGRLIAPVEEPTAPISLLAVGAIDFDATIELALADSRPLVRSSSWGRWPRLSATGAELHELEYQAKEFLEIEPEILSGKDVTEEALRSAVADKRYVHLATHGWFMPETVRSMLDRDSGNDTPLLGTRRTVTGFAPLTLCGLVLSGANNAKTEAERSARLLTAQELAEFDLTACDLAVLSACETNVGIARAGQGIQSLQTALHRAGARTSITSLWSVQDWPTQSLMKRFYDNLWEHGMSKADALWAAKCSLREEGQPPRVWAGWILAGDPD